MYICAMKADVYILDLDCVSKIGRDAKSVRPRVRVKLAEMQKTARL